MKRSNKTAKSFGSQGEIYVVLIVFISVYLCFGASNVHRLILLLSDKGLVFDDLLTSSKSMVAEIFSLVY